MTAEATRYRCPRCGDERETCSPNAYIDHRCRQNKNRVTRYEIVTSEEVAG